ncbi:MAG TPA: VOC family protein [Pyrinomonadaceae bacterium]|nr:VOC family protein [Pyrinomonadaceae bacterium]
MAEFKLPKHGTICWRELATKDLATAEAFYKEMFGWTMEQSKSTPMQYLEIVYNDQAVGGMMPIDEKWGPEPPPSHWGTYIAIASADETVAKIKENGGAVKQEPFDAPGIGRIALVSDPCGAPFAIIQFEQSAT